MNKKNVTVIKNIGRALEVLSSFTINEPELGVSEIAAKLGIYKSTVYRILKTLEQYGFVIQNIHNQKYRLGFKLFDLGAAVISKLEVRDVALPFMQKLCSETRESVALNVIDNDERVCIEKVESPESIKNVIPIGYRCPLHLSAGGKVLLAYLPENEIKRIIYKKQLKHTAAGKPIDPDNLYKELQLITKQGYAFSNNEVSIGASAVAAPIRNYTNSVIASISVHGPEQRFNKERLETLIKGIVETTNSISVRLGWINS